MYRYADDASLKGQCKYERSWVCMCTILYRTIAVCQIYGFHGEEKQRTQRVSELYFGFFEFVCIESVLNLKMFLKLGLFSICVSNNYGARYPYTRTLKFQRVTSCQFNSKIIYIYFSFIKAKFASIHSAERTKITPLYSQ